MNRFCFQRVRAVGIVKRFTCDELVELVTAYLDDALDEPVRDDFEAHARLCAACTRHLDQFRTTIRMLGELPPERLSEDVRDRLMTAFRQRRR
jgi:anti-sigma factor RsiW